MEEKEILNFFKNLDQPAQVKTLNMVINHMLSLAEKKEDKDDLLLIKKHISKIDRKKREEIFKKLIGGK